MKMIKEEELKELLTRNIESLRSLNFNETYIKSIVENVKKWAETGLLNFIKDPYISRNVATLFDNQIKWNESIDDSFAQIKRTSIPLIRRIMAESFIGYQIVSVQALKSGDVNRQVYSTAFDGKTTPHTTETGIRQISYGIPFSEDSCIDEETGQHSLDKEAQLVAEFAKTTANELNREIIRDLALNAGKSGTYEYKDEDQLLGLIEGMSSYIATKCHNREANWIVTSPEIVKLLTANIEFSDGYEENYNGVSFVGSLKKENISWRLFEDSSALDGDILLGLKDPQNHFFAGYIFSPIIVINPLKAESSEGKSKILFNYGKRLLNPNFYGVLRIENLSEISNLNLESEEPSEGDVE